MLPSIGFSYSIYAVRQWWPNGGALSPKRILIFTSGTIFPSGIFIVSLTFVKKYKRKTNKLHILLLLFNLKKYFLKNSHYSYGLF